MTTRRNRTLEDEGTVFVNNVVRHYNCIFQEVDLANDQGNDCYIEFITDEVATSFCVFAQIKSGRSYRDKSGYKIPADFNHLNYWNNHTNPVVGIVYDEQLQEAFWVNISEYLFNKPEVFKLSTHTIRVSRNNKLSDFQSFKKYFTEYIKEYKDFENYGRSLDNFAKVDDSIMCYDGFKSLYSNHRNRLSAWTYIISNFSKIKYSGIQINILGAISNFIPSDDILWSQNNTEFLYNIEINKKLCELLTEGFGLKEVSMAIDFIRDGITRGSYNYLIYKVLSLIADIGEKILQITYSEKDSERRDFDFWLYVHFNQWASIESTILDIEKYLNSFTDADPDGIIKGMKDSLQRGILIPIG